MKSFEKFLDKISFRKVFRIYFSVSVLILLVCGISIAYVTRDKIRMAMDYGRVLESFRHKGGVSGIKDQLNKLAYDSADILNIIAVDKDYTIIYKSNSNLAGGSGKFLLIPYSEDKRYLQDGINKDIIYKVVREENILINRDYIKNHDKILSDIDTDFSYQMDLGTAKINLLNYMINRGTGEKIFVIRTASPIPHVERIIEVTGLFLGLIGMIYWIGLALWVYRDANRKNINPALWGLLVLLTNLAGLIVYTIYKQSSRICQECGTLQSRENAFCITCGTQINEICGNCHSIVGKNNHFCSKCGNEL